jgi:beta-lactam-binding protein with PASTA domain
METLFTDARSDLISQRVAVVLIFGQNPPPDGKLAVVVATSPDAGTRLHPGLTVKLYVSGPPPPLAVPALPTAKTKCSAWGSQLVATGFQIAYDPPGSKNQYVWKETPDQTDTTTTWNQTITLSCNATGTPPPPPSSSPSPAPSDTSTP